MYRHHYDLFHAQTQTAYTFIFRYVTVIAIFYSPNMVDKTEKNKHIHKLKYLNYHTRFNKVMSRHQITTDQCITRIHRRHGASLKCTVWLEAADLLAVWAPNRLQ